MTGTPSGPSKCRFAGHGVCRGKITGEHYISYALLRCLGASRTIFVQGTPWSSERLKEVGKSGLTANILCEGHNSRLAPLDELSGRLMKALQLAQLELQRGSHKSQTHTYIGPRLERWLLKVCYMMWAGGVFAERGSRIPGTPPDKWIGIILGELPMPPKWGLYIEVASESFGTSGEEFEVTPAAGNDGSGIKMARFKLARIPFTLVLGQPDDPSAFGFYRTEAIILDNEKARHTFRLSWPDGAASGPVRFTRIGDAPEPAENAQG